MFTVYGPPGETFSESTHYTGSETDWLSVQPLSTTFNSSGLVTFVVHYKWPALWPLGGAGRSAAEIQVTTGGTNVLQTVHTELWR